MRHIRSIVPRLRSARRLTVAVVLAVLSAFLSPSVFACEGEPIAARCGRSVVLGLATPTNVLATGGPTTVQALLYLGITEFPAGSGLCPPPPFFVDFDLTITCTPEGDTTAVIEDVEVSRGYNEIDLVVDLPSGPPRLCTIDGAAEVSFSDGTTATASGGTQICLVEEAPTLPGIPRLELESLVPELARVHPGDQASHRVRLTNNDPISTFFGGVDVDMVNRSLLPLVGPPMPPGHGLFGIADPVGDHFPIAFGDELNVCLPLPPMPQLVPIPMLQRDLELLPGQSVELEVVSRPWGMCAEGSCGQGSMLFDGTFGDATPGFACLGFVTATELAAPPSFAWPDAGESALVGLPPLPEVPELPFSAQPGPGIDPFTFLFTLPQADLLLPAQQPLPAQFLAGALDAERGRIRLGFEDPKGLMPTDPPFDLGFQMALPPLPESGALGAELFGFNLVPNAPTGLETLGPLFAGLLAVSGQPGTDPFVADAYFELVMRLSGVAVDDLGQERQVLFQNIQAQPQPGSNVVDFFVQAQLEPGPNAQVQGLEIFVDLRAHAKLGEFIFNDGFNLGDTSGWDVTVP
ncbi:MAG: hypothetical protein AAGN46_11260 [Acidobacteriota bacterium]